MMALLFICYRTKPYLRNLTTPALTPPEGHHYHNHLSGNLLPDNLFSKSPKIETAKVDLCQLFKCPELIFFVVDGIRSDDVGSSGQVESDEGVRLEAPLRLPLDDVATVNHLHLDDVADLLHLLVLEDDMTLFIGTDESRLGIKVSLDSFSLRSSTRR